MTQKRTRYRDLPAYFEGTGRTQEDLAGRLGISQSHLSLIARGLRQPSLPLAFRIEEMTGIPADAFVVERAS